jgi:hypothetical protein
LDYFPELNLEWLLTGKGATLREHEEASGAVSVPNAGNGSSDKYLKLLEKYTQLQEDYTALLNQNIASYRGREMGTAAVK